MAPGQVPDALPPDLLERGGLGVTVGFVRYAKGGDADGACRMRVENGFLPLGGGLELESLRLESLAHLLASKIQLHLQAHGWGAPRPGDGDPTSGEGSPL